ITGIWVMLPMSVKIVTLSFGMRRGSRATTTQTNQDMACAAMEVESNSRTYKMLQRYYMIWCMVMTTRASISRRTLGLTIVCSNSPRWVARLIEHLIILGDHLRS
ncbi:hypothetical protein PIB30_113277, partial [Stylosanthes scabra]|nr:hypothetical protein [Stylosanthes scabra]